MLYILLSYKLKSIYNSVRYLNRWELLKRFIFGLVGLLILVSLYFGFLRVLGYLESVALIGPLLSWKLTSMAFLTTFSMIMVSGLIISMTTLFYSRDLQFLFSSPVEMRALFTDKAVETVFYSSWTLALALVPYVLALGNIKHAGPGFYAGFVLLMPPFILSAAAFGMILSIALMYAFPASRTRDVIWILGSLSLAFVYVMLRFSRPERLLRPDTLEVVAQYLQYLQSPTAEYAPSWWLVKAIMSILSGNMRIFLFYAGLLFVFTSAIYSVLIYISGIMYLRGFSGAQEGRRFRGGYSEWPERRYVFRNMFFRNFIALFWKDRKLFA